MSFIDRVIAASLGGQARGLRPMPTSRFAPAMVIEEAPLDGGAIIEAPPMVGSEPALERRRPSPRPRPSLGEPPVPPAPRRAAPLSPLLSQARPSPANPTPVSDAVVETTPPLVAAASPIASPATHDAIDSSRDAPLVAAHAPVAAHDDAEPWALRSPARRGEPDRASSSPAIGRAERVAGAPSRTRASSLAAADAAAPDIHVTIGRIDVRALVPTPPPPRSPAAPSRPRLTLDHYLSDRGRK